MMKPHLYVSTPRLCLKAKTLSPSTDIGGFCSMQFLTGLDYCPGTVIEYVS